MLHYFHMWIIYALLSAAAASLVAIFGKIGVKGVDSTLATAIRAGVMFLLMTLAAASLKKLPEITAVPGKVLLWIILSGAAGAVSWFFYFLALKTGPATGTAALDRLSAVFVVILAALFLGEKMTIAHAAGAALLTVGAILLVR
jgi:transporter family protein